MKTHPKKKNKTAKNLKSRIKPKKDAGKLLPQPQEQLQDSDFNNEYDVAYDPHKFGI